MMIVETAIRNLMVCGVILAMSCCSLSAKTTKPEIILSTVVPVVNNEIEFTLRNVAGEEGEISFSVIQEGKEVFQEKVIPAEKKAAVKWTPKETGFYTAVFDTASEKIKREFPVVWRELYFLTWPPLAKAEAEGYRYLSSYVTLPGLPGSGYGEDEISYWKSKGSKTLGYTYGMQVVDMGISEEEAIKKAVAIWSTPIKKGFDGIFMDEFGEYPLPELLKKVERAGKALIQLRKENPDMLIFPASGGALLREEAISYKYSDCIALLETYGTCFTKYFGSHSIKKHIDHRIEVARNTDLIYEAGRKHGALILLGLNGCDAFHEEPPIPELEDSVRYIKKTAPEMPGIGFYGAGATKQYLIESGLLKAAEEFCLKYYIKPVVDIRDIWFSDYSPTQGKSLDIFVNVHNLGGMDAKGIKVKLYVSEVGRNDKKAIGEVEIAKIGCGFMELTKRGGKEQLYEYQETNGNKYAVFDKYNTVFLARTTVKLSWKPKKKGYYSITAEVEPSEQYTILDGIQEKRIAVKQN